MTEPDFELEIDVGRRGEIDEGLVVEALAEADALPEKAFADFRRAARGEPGDPDYAYILGNALAHRGNHAEAVAAFREAIALDREQALYFTSLGIALWRLDRFDEAIAAFEDALKLSPADAQALNGLGLALLGAGRPAEALAVLLRACGADRTAPEPRSNRAVALWRAGRPHDAVLSWQEAAAEWPEAPLVQRNLGRALLAQERLPQALECFRAVARMSEDDADARLDLADVLYQLGRNAEADEAYDEAARIDPRSIARRPSSLDARRTIVIERLREDLKPRPAAGERAARAGLDRRGFGRPRRGPRPRHRPRVVGTQRGCSSGSSRWRRPGSATSSGPRTRATTSSRTTCARSPAPRVDDDGLRARAPARRGRGARPFHAHRARVLPGGHAAALADDHLRLRGADAAVPGIATQAPPAAPRARALPGRAQSRLLLTRPRPRALARRPRGSESRSCARWRGLRVSCTDVLTVGDGVLA